MDIPEYDDIKFVHEQYTDEMLQAIGAFFLAASTAECSLMFALDRLQTHPHPGTLNSVASLFGMQNKVLLEKIGVAAMIANPESSKEVEKLCGKIRRVFEHRNNIAHAIAIAGEGERLVVQPMKLSLANPRFEKKTYTLNEITEYTRKLYRLVRHLSDRLNDFGIRRSAKLLRPEDARKARP